LSKESHLVHLIDAEELSETATGYTDPHLLTSVLLTEGGRVWTRDKKLHAQAERLGTAYLP
jgi:hypothetical protein